MKTLTWNVSWVNPYESGWSILEKIKYANLINSRDLHREFDLRNLVPVIEYDILEQSKQILTRLTGMFPNTDYNHYLIRSDLTYCEKCLCMGHHSIFHQFSLLHQCPFHLCDLRNTCSKCDQQITYNYINFKILEGFRCKCSEFIIEMNIKSLSEWQLHLPIKDELLLKWLEIDVTLAATMFKNDFFYFPHLIKEPGAMQLILNYYDFKRAQQGRYFITT